jgi:hypothetical protein
MLKFINSRIMLAVTALCMVSASETSGSLTWPNRSTMALYAYVYLVYLPTQAAKKAVAFVGDTLETVATKIDHRLEAIQDGFDNLNTTNQKIS